MDIIAPFGYVTGCHAGDKFMVQATLASLRRYCADVPICLVVDGAVDVDDLVQTYNLQVLRTSNLSNPNMRKLCSGSYYAKLSAMWEGPFDHFVWLDSDAIAWGDFTHHIDLSLDFQIFWSEISIPPDATEIPSWLGHFYFDLPKLLECDPDFEWRGWPYFSTGAFACRRNVISFEDWIRIFNWESQFKEPIFKFGEQGQLEYMVHSYGQLGKIKVGCADLQYLTRHHGRGEIDKDSESCGWKFPSCIARPRVVHFCGQKPYLHNWRAYSKAFTIARLEHYRKAHGELGAWIAIIMEEFSIITSKVTRKLVRLIR